MKRIILTLIVFSLVLAQVQNKIVNGQDANCAGVGNYCVGRVVQQFATGCEYNQSSGTCKEMGWSPVFTFQCDSNCNASISTGSWGKCGSSSVITLCNTEPYSNPYILSCCLYAGGGGGGGGTFNCPVGTYSQRQDECKNECSGGWQSGGNCGTCGKNAQGDQKVCCHKGFCIPEKPQNFSFTCNGDDTATAAWNANPAATGYALRVDDLSDGWIGVEGKGNNCATTNPGDVCVNDIVPPTVSYTFPITPGRTYNSWVYTRRGTANGGWSDPSYLYNMTCNVPTNTPTPTPVPGAWIKLKNTSFLSTHSLSNNIPAVPIAYDYVDDIDSETLFIRGSAGLAAAPSIALGSGTAGSPEYKATYSPSPYSFTPNSFRSYIKARKQHKVITSLSEINADGIYIYEGNISIDSDSAPFNTTRDIVLISTGTVTVTRIAPDVTFAPGGSIAIIAPTISFNANITQANGIFIANNITTGSPANQGLKIIGNLIALESLTNDREWTNPNKPSLFIVFDQQKYIDLLPYLSTANYEWRQIQ